jgi:transcriptional regulator with XRE-family HTH domain
VIGPDAVSFSDLLRQYRTAAGLTQRELAERANLSIRTIQNMEQGHSVRPYQRTVRLLASALDVTGPAAAELSDLARQRNGSAGTDPVSAPPRQLPPAAAQFVGREAELDALTDMLAESGGSGSGGVVVISAINGTAGIGKTTLALHWAHRAAARFPDGQLYVDLRGFSAGAPVTPSEAIRSFLDALGLAPESLPAGEEAQAALFRSSVAGRRLLIVLDNARDAGQVRPLLPGSPGCMVLVTSRASLDGLAVSEGARLLTLDVLSEQEARQLLAARLGGERLAADPLAVSELIRLCAELPLALTVAAARVISRPGFPLAAAAAELREAAGRLDALETGDLASSVRPVFSWSYRNLSEPAAAMFRLVGLHPGPDLTVPAAASSAGIPLRAARRCLDELTRAHMLAEQPPGRFRCHDLLRAYADEQAAGLSEDDRRQVLCPDLDHYVHTGHRASALLNPHRAPIAIKAAACSAAAANTWRSASNQARAPRDLRRPELLRRRPNPRQGSRSAGRSTTGNRCNGHASERQASDQGVPGRAEQSAGSPVETESGKCSAVGQRSRPSGRHHIAVGDQRVYHVADQAARHLDRVLVVVARPGGPLPGWRVAVVEIVRRDDLVEVFRAPVGVAVKELPHDVLGTQLFTHCSSPMTTCERHNLPQSTVGAPPARRVGMPARPVPVASSQRASANAKGRSRPPALHRILSALAEFGSSKMARACGQASWACSWSPAAWHVSPRRSRTSPLLAWQVPTELSLPELFGSEFLASCGPVPQP